MEKVEDAPNPRTIVSPLLRANGKKGFYMWVMWMMPKIEWGGETEIVDFNKADKWQREHYERALKARRYLRALTFEATKKVELIMKGKLL